LPGRYAPAAMNCLPQSCRRVRAVRLWGHSPGRRHQVGRTLPCSRGWAADLTYHFWSILSREAEAYMEQNDERTVDGGGLPKRRSSRFTSSCLHHGGVASIPRAFQRPSLEGCGPSCASDVPPHTEGLMLRNSPTSRRCRRAAQAVFPTSKSHPPASTGKASSWRSLSVRSVFGDRSRSSGCLGDPVAPRSKHHVPAVQPSGHSCLVQPRD